MMMMMMMVVVVVLPGVVVRTDQEEFLAATVLESVREREGGREGVWRLVSPPLLSSPLARW